MDLIDGLWRCATDLCISKDTLLYYRVGQHRAIPNKTMLHPKFIPDGHKFMLSMFKDGAYYSFTVQQFVATRGQAHLHWARLDELDETTYVSRYVIKEIVF